MLLRFRIICKRCIFEIVEKTNKESFIHSFSKYV